VRLSLTSVSMAGLSGVGLFSPTDANDCDMVFFLDDKQCLADQTIVASTSSKKIGRVRLWDPQCVVNSLIWAMPVGCARGGIEEREKAGSPQY
jgi:hypothetical protein